MTLPRGYETDVHSSASKGTIAKDSGWPDPPEPAAFHGAAGEFVETVVPHSEADPAALLAQYLAAAGNLFGTGCYYQVEGDQHPARLWVVICGATSKARKGTSWSRVRQVAAEVDAAWAERITGGLSSGEGPVWAVRDPIYRQVKRTNEDGEDEFVDVLDDPGVADKRLMVIESELSRIFDVIGRAGNTLSETGRRLWDGGTVSNLSKNSSFKATDPHVSVIGHISRQELRSKIDDTEVWNGFANRFMLIAARRTKLLPFGGELDPDDRARLRQQLGAAVSAAGQHNGRISWSKPATARWSEIYEQLSSEKSGMVGAVTARAEAHVVRLAVTYSQLDMARVISLPHLEAALALWEYSERSAQWAFGDSTGDPIADAILQALIERGDEGMTREEISKLFHRNLQSERITDALTVLVIRHRARMEREETGGRPAERWFTTAGRP